MKLTWSRIRHILTGGDGSYQCRSNANVSNLIIEKGQLIKKAPDNKIPEIGRRINKAVQYNKDFFFNLRDPNACKLHDEVE